MGVTAAYLGFGLLAFVGWRLTGNGKWFEEFFRLPGALLLVSLAMVELLFSLQVTREFSPNQALHKAWYLIAFSAGCSLVSALSVQVFSVKSVLNPLTHFDWWSNSMGLFIRQFGLVIGGTCRFALLAAGLFWVLRVYRQSGFLARLSAVDWGLLALLGAYIVREFYEVVVAIKGGTRFSAGVILGWPVDPLLWLLLAEALMLHKSVRQMGEGWIGRCWKSFSVAIFLVALGDATMWAGNWGYLRWPWSALEWLVWIPAAGAFALAPTYQLEAIHHAHSLSREGLPLRKLSR
ncbi:MAG TPA: hypothetical protein VGH38_30790 [Bryobacteraceae bacterium]|jgi:hypothetical protein